MTTQNTNTPAVQNPQSPAAGGVPTAKELFSSPNIKSKFEELLGKRAPQFMTSVLQVVQSSHQLKNADPQSIYAAAAVAATLDLPINPNLGFAYIIPYNTRKGNEWIVLAQFQMGYKGFIQLAQRTGLFKSISACHVTDRDTINGDRLIGESFEFAKPDPKVEKIVGYAAYFKLLNGFEKTLYMTVEELTEHATQFSKSYTNDKEKSLWHKDPYSMSIKTVIKLLLSKYAPLSIETQHVQSALMFDQSVIDSNTMQPRYIDNESAEPAVNKEKERMTLLINDAKSLEQLESLLNDIEGEEMEILFREKHTSLSAKLLQK